MLSFSRYTSMGNLWLSIVIVMLLKEVCKADKTIDVDTRDKIVKAKLIDSSPSKIFGLHPSTKNRGSDIGIKRPQNFRSESDPDPVKASATHHHHHKKGGKGWLDMGAWTHKKGSYGWYADFPVGFMK